MKRRAPLYLTASLIACAVPLQALAQAEDSAVGSSGAAESAGDDIIVTGSRIRGVAPVGSATISVGQEELAQTTAANVADMLKEVPQIIGNGITDTSYATSTGAGSSNLSRGTGVNLRGLGPAATLVLFDGQRVTGSGVAATFVDPSVIPTIAVQRIEIVPDGSSALYGSDAVSGVVNVITRKSVTGVEASARFIGARGYQRGQVSVIGGHDWGTGRAVVAYEFNKNGSLNSTERSAFYRQDQRDRGGRDYRVSTCNPGNVVLGGVSYALPGTSAPTGADLVANTRNLCDNGDFDIIPAQTRHNVFAYLEQEIGDRLKVSVQGFYSNREFFADYRTQGSNLANEVTLTVPSTNAFFISPTGTFPASETVEFSYYPMRGPIVAHGKAETWGVFGNVTLELPIERWQAGVSVGHTRNSETVASRNIDTAAQAAALASSDPNKALDVFGNRTNPAVIDAIFSGQFVPYGINELTSVNLRFDGPLFSLPAGEVKLAIGGEYQAGSAVRGTGRGTITAPTINRLPAERNVKSAFAELFVPVTSTLDVSAAVRYDHYSDFGSTTNPKFGVTWRPMDELRLRASYGTSFRAPALSELILTTVGLQVTNAVDPLSPTGRSNGISIRAVNPDLGPETAKTWSIGADLKLERLTLSLNYFNIEYNGLIFAVEGRDALVNAAIYGDLITRNPTAAQLAALYATGLPVIGTLPPVIDFIVDSRPLNRGSTKTAGFDFVLNYVAVDSDFGKLSLGANGNFFTKYQFQVTPLAPSVDRLSSINYPVKFRARFGVDFQRDGFNANVWLNHLSAYSNTQVTPVQRVDAYDTVDLHIGYDFGKGGVLNDASIALDITNLFDRDPPFVDSQFGYDPQQANALGRTFAVTLTKKF